MSILYLVHVLSRLSTTASCFCSSSARAPMILTWLVDCFGLNGPLRQYFSLSGRLPQRGRKKKNDRREKNVQTTPPASTASAVGPCPALIHISRTPRHWKFTRHHRPTRQSLYCKPQTGNMSADDTKLTIMFFQSIRHKHFEKKCRTEWV